MGTIDDHSHRGAVQQGAGAVAYRSAAAGSQYPWTRGDPGARGHRPGGAVGQAHPSGRGDHLHPGGALEYQHGRAAALAAGTAPPAVSVPVGFTTFPGESFRAPRSWVELGYPTLSYFHEADRGGHFAAWEEPELFATEIRAAFRSLR